MRKKTVSFFLALSIFFFLTACKEQRVASDIKPKALGDTLVLAEQRVTNQPLLALEMTKRIFSNPAFQPLSNEAYIKLYQINQKAYSHLKQMDSVLHYGEKIRSYATPLGDSLSIARSIILIRGDVDYNEQMKVFHRLQGAMATFKENEMPYEEGVARAMYGTMLISKGELTTAQKYLMEAYSIFEKLDSNRARSTACLNIGSTYSEINRFKEAYRYYNEALMISRKYNDSMKIASSALNIGILFRENHNNADSALFYLKMAKQHIPPYAGMLKTKIDYDIAGALAEKGNVDEARDFYQKILEEFSNAEMVEGIAMAHKGLGEVAYQVKDYPLALNHLNTSLSILDTLGMQVVVKSMLPFLSKSYAALGNYQAAYQIDQKLINIKDSLFTIEQHNAINEIESKYQAEKKEIEIKALTKDNTIKKAFLFALTIVLLIVSLLFRQRNLLIKERTLAYDALMDKYKWEKKQREIHANEISALELTISSNEIPKSTSNEEGLYEQILNYYIKEKPYLNSKFRVDDLAQEMNSNQKEIAQVLKQSADANFTSFTNKFRIEAARKMFEDPTYRDIKMEVISKNSGFGTIQSFYNAFELYTGVKPAYYRSSI